MRRIFAIQLLCMISFYCIGQNSVDQIKSRIDSNLTALKKNKVVLKTDKDVYFPGETVWFNAVIKNCITQEKVNEKELIVLIQTESGEVYVDNKFSVLNGVVENNFQIPDWVKEGNAFLVAYTSTIASHNDASVAAIQPIYINQLNKTDVSLQLFSEKKIYRSGDDAKIKATMRSVSASSKREKIEFAVYDFETLIYSEIRKIPVNQTIEFSYKIPAKINNALFALVRLEENENVSKKIRIPTYKDEIKVEFYPEGGTLISNHIQRIVYRSVDWFGNPISIKGNVYDNNGNRVGLAKPLKPGYGVIKLMPMQKQSYYLQIDGKYRNSKFLLPELNYHGTSFSYIKINEHKLMGKLSSTGNMLGKNLLLVAMAKGRIIWHRQMVAKEVLKIEIDQNELPLGLVNFIVFDNDGAILSERLVMNSVTHDDVIRIGAIKHEDSYEINIDASSFQSMFGKTRIDISVVDEQNLAEPSVVELNCNLRYPLSIQAPKSVLDFHMVNIELIANKNKHYSSAQLIEGAGLQPDLPVLLKGVVSDKQGNTVAGANVVAFNNEQLTHCSTLSNANGGFELKGISWSGDLKIKAFDPESRKKYTVRMEHSFNQSLDEQRWMMSLNLPTYYRQDKIYNYFQLNKKLLKKTIRADQVSTSKQDVLNQYLGNCTDVLDIIKMMKPFYLKGNEIVFHGSAKSFQMQTGALIVIDGQKRGTDISVLKCLSPFDIESLNVYTEPGDIHQYTALNSVGVIEIETKRYKGSTIGSDFITKSNFTPDNFSKDDWQHQTTLYWDTNVELDKNGKYQIQVQASGIKSTFVIRVDATSESGITEQKEMRIKIN